MKKIALLSLVSLTALSTLQVSAADIISPPSLQTVMQKNERYDRTEFLRQKRLERQNRTLSGSISTGTLIPEPAITYRTISNSSSVKFSRANEAELWVQELDLSAGARLSSSLTLGGYDPDSGEPLFQKKKLSEVLTAEPKAPFSIINGQFFDPRKDPTTLSFGLKMDGEVRTAGADNRNSSKNILSLESGKASITPYSWENLRDAPGYFAMVNLTLDDAHYPNDLLGRTYMCLQNPDTNNTSSKLAIFTATAMRESALQKEMMKFGCTRASSSKLDSSGSTRLWTGGEYIFGNSHNGAPDYRKIPHSILVWEK